MNHIDIDMHRALSELDDPRRGIALKRNTAIDLVTALIDFLDETEGDCDLEPSLGYSPFEDIAGVDLEGDGIDNGDFQGEGVDGNPDDEDDGTAEPSLGSAERGTVHVLPFGWLGERNGYEQRLATGQQLDWGAGGRADLEVGEGDDEPDVDDEPSLGAPELGEGGLYLLHDSMSVISIAASQERWAAGRGDMEEEAINEDGDEGELGA